MSYSGIINDVATKMHKRHRNEVGQVIRIAMTTLLKGWIS